VKDIIKNFIKSNLNIYAEDATFSDDENIFEAGFVDSMFSLQLVEFVEKEFGISVTNDDLDPKNFCSVDALVAFVGSKKSGS
jgi:acyl carrier protein